MTRVSPAHVVIAVLIITLDARTALSQDGRRSGRPEAVGTKNTAAGSLTRGTSPVGSQLLASTQKIQLRVVTKKGAACTDPDRDMESDCATTRLAGDTLRPPLYYEKGRWLQEGMEPSQLVKFCIFKTTQCFGSFTQQYKKDGDRYQELRQKTEFSDLSNLPHCLTLQWIHDLGVSSSAFEMLPLDGNARGCR